MKVSWILLLLTLIQYAVLHQWLPSVVKIFNPTHEDLLFWIALMTYFIILPIEKRVDNGA